MDAYTITMPLPPPELSPNSRAHYMARGRATRMVKDQAFYMMLEQLDRERPTWERARLSIVWQTTNAGHLPDKDNVVAWAKAGIDGVALTGLVENDRHVEIGDIVTRVGPRRELTLTFERVDQ